LAFLGAAGAALGLIPFKLATREADAQHLAVALLALAAILNTAGSAAHLARRRVADRTIDSMSGLGEVDVEVGGPAQQPSLRVTVWAGIVLGVLAAMANVAAAEAVARLDASISSLLIQLQVLFAVVLGWIWLGERVTARFVFGAGVALAGVVVVQGGGDGGTSSADGVVWGLGAAACFGAMQVFTRRYIERIEVVWVNVLRLWIAVGLISLVPGSLAGALDLPAKLIALVALAAVCGPIFGRLMLIASARYIPAATTTLIGLSAPVVALVGDWLVLDSVPAAGQWLGGIIVAVGVLAAIMPTRSRRTAPDVA
jgi:drug/metabolite transporter (DMT)-like permease